MPNTDTKVSQLIINELTKEQFDRAVEAGQVSDTELYLVEDEGGSGNAFTPDNLKGGKGIEIVKSGTIEKETINIGRFDMGHLKIQNTQKSVATTSFDIAFYFTTGAYFNQYERIWMDASRPENQDSSQIALWEGNYCFNLHGETDLTLHKVITNPLILTKYAIRAKLTEDGIITLYNKIGTWEGDWNIVEQFGANPEQYIFSNDLWGCGLRLQDYYGQCIFNGTINRTLSYITINGVEVFGETNVGEIVGNPTLTTEIITIEGEGDGYVINSTAPYITEQYDDGQGNGYRKWSNKFCEQWGIILPTGADTNMTVSLPQEYKNYDYSVFVNMQWHDAGSALWQYFCARNLTLNSFDITRQGTVKTNWKTEGYIL